MKNVKLIVAGSIIAISLSACITGPAEEGQQPSESQEPATTADSLLDDQLYNTAIETNDVAECEKIEDSAKAEECKNVVNAGIYTAKAVEATDKDFCDDIELERYKENCEASVDRKLAEENAEEEFMNMLDEMGEIEANAVEKQDPELCMEIEDTSSRIACKANAISDKVMETKDASLCQAISKGEDDESSDHVKWAIVNCESILKME